MRTKLVFALVAVSLASMALLGWFTYSNARGLLTEGGVERLEALAASKEDGVRTILNGWHNRVVLMAGQNELTRAVEDHLASSQTTDLLAVRDRSGSAIASVSRGDLAEDVSSRLAAASPNPSDDPRSPVTYQGAVLSEGGLRFGFSSQILSGDEPLASLQVIVRPDQIEELVSSAEGLGATGETLVMIPAISGGAYVLRTGADAPSRPPTGGAGDVVEALIRATEGEESTYRGDIFDADAAPVWMSTRHVPESGWAVAVQRDAAEETAQIDAFREDLVNLGLSLAAFAILVGTLMGIRFGKPIHDLARVATQIRDGELDARATVTGEDEIGLLAHTFNEMADELERQMSLLKEFHKFFELSIDMLCIAGTDGYFRRTNPAFGRVLGWTEEELKSRQFFDFCHPDDVEATRAEVDKLAEGIPTISFINRYLCKDGGYKHLLWTSQPDAETGTLYAVARDVTEYERGGVALRLLEAEHEIAALRRELEQTQGRMRGTT